MRPGITVLFPSPPCGLLDLSLPLVLFSGVERGENCLHRDPTACNELGATAPQCRRKRRGPGVLVDQKRGGAAWFERSARLLDVVLSQQARRGPLEHGEVELAVLVQVGDGDAPNRSVQLFFDEGQIEEPDDASVDEVDEQREAFPGHSAAGELDHQIVDRTHFFKIVHVNPFAAWTRAGSNRSGSVRPYSPEVAAPEGASASLPADEMAGIRDDREGLWWWVRTT